MAGRNLKEVPSLEDVEQPGHVEFHIRGKLYEIDEIEARHYEEAVKTATDADGENTDMNLLTKLITLQAVKCDGEPLNPETWSHQPFPVVNRVQNEVRRVHYIEVETDEEAAERQKAEKEAAAAADKAKKKEGPGLPNS